MAQSPGTGSESCEAGWRFPPLDPFSHPEMAPRKCPKGAGSLSHSPNSAETGSPLKTSGQKAQMRPLVLGPFCTSLSRRAGMLSWATGNLWPEMSACLPRTKLQRGAQSLTLRDIPRPALSGGTPRSSHDAALPAARTPLSRSPVALRGSLSRAGRASVMHCGNIAWYHQNMQCNYNAPQPPVRRMRCAREGWGPLPRWPAGTGAVRAACSKCRVLAGRTWGLESRKGAGGCLPSLWLSSSPRTGGHLQSSHSRG